MKSVRELTYPLTLTTAELAYLFSLVGAGTMLGVDTTKLFPIDQAQRETQWQAGQAELVADGWLVIEPESSRAEINDDLLLIVEALAYPQIVVLTTVELPIGERGSVYHYLAPEGVVEVAIEQDTYALVALESTKTMIGRLAHTLKLPDEADASATFILSRQQLERIKLDPDPEPLITQGLAPATAELFVAALHQPFRRAKLLLLRAQAAEVTATRMIGLQSDHQSHFWIATPQPNEIIHYRAADQDQFGAVLNTFINELQAVVAS